jgi:ParB family chromosome partitioning protein
MKKGLGRGLGAILDDNTDISESGVLEISINEIEPRKDQPRKRFDDIKLNDLAESIKSHGVVQPIIVTLEDDIYRIVAGERRWRAARIVGLSKVPVIIRDYTKKEEMEIALIENLQREDLNPLEEAEAYDKLLKVFKMTQEDISASIGKSRSAIANTVRLLNLSDELKEYLENGQLSSGHARALMSLDDEARKLEFANTIIKKNLSVREAEKGVKKLLKGSTVKKIIDSPPEIKALEETLSEFFGTKVNVQHHDNRGKISIEYYSNEDLERILEIIK